MDHGGKLGRGTWSLEGGDHLTPSLGSQAHSQQGCSRRLLSGGEKPWENHNVRASCNPYSVNLLTRPHFKQPAAFQ